MRLSTSLGINDIKEATVSFESNYILIFNFNMLYIRNFFNF